VVKVAKATLVSEKALDEALSSVWASAVEVESVLGEPLVQRDELKLALEFFLAYPGKTHLYRVPRKPPPLGSGPSKKTATFGVITGWAPGLILWEFGSEEIFKSLELGEERWFYPPRAAYLFAETLKRLELRYEPLAQRALKERHQELENALGPLPRGTVEVAKVKPPDETHMDTFQIAITQYGETYLLLGQGHFAHVPSYRDWGSWTKALDREGLWPYICSWANGELSPEGTKKALLIAGIEL
jgi:hypothetical protein